MTITISTRRTIPSTRASAAKNPSQKRSNGPGERIRDLPGTTNSTRTIKKRRKIHLINSGIRITSSRSKGGNRRRSRRGGRTKDLSGITISMSSWVVVKMMSRSICRVSRVRGRRLIGRRRGSRRSMGSRISMSLRGQRISLITDQNHKTEDNKGTNKNII